MQDLYRVFTAKYILLFSLFILFNKETVAQLSKINHLKDQLQKADTELGRAEIYSQLGILYTNRALDSAYYYGSLALEASEKLKDQKVKADALNVLAFYYMEKGNTYLAYKFVNESLSYFEKLDYLPGICMLNMNLGVFMIREGKRSQALEQYELANEKSLALENDSLRSVILLNIAVAKSLNLSYKELEKIYDEAYHIAEKYNDERMLIGIEQARVNAKLRNGYNVLEGRSKLYQLIQRASDKGFDMITATCFMDYGNTFLNENIDSSAYYFDKGIELAERMGYNVLHYQLLAHAYESFNKIPPYLGKAKPYGDLMLKLGAQLRENQPSGGIDFLELAIKEQEMEVEQAKYEIRRLWMIGSVLVGIIAVVITLLILRQFLLKKKLVTQLEDMNHRLISQNTQLEENDEFQKKLLAILSHDLRQPFSSIIMMSQGVLEDLEKHEQAGVFDQIHQSASVSLQTIDGLLYWMKLQTLGLAYTPNHVLVMESVEQALDYNRQLLSKRKINISFDADDSLFVNAQREMLLFVNRNLLHNAIKYSPNGGMILISVQEEDHDVIIRIADQGPGIPEDEIDFLFAKNKEHSFSPRNHNGVGIALIICYDMIAEMSGKIWVENNADGRGASFYYRLPVGQPKNKIQHEIAVLKEN